MNIFPSSVGENNKMARLKESDVYLIRKMKTEGYSTKEIAEKFNISYRYANKVIYSVRWSHIPTRVLKIEKLLSGPTCLHPECEGVPRRRGLCIPCYESLYALIQKRVITFEEAERKNKCLPIKRRRFHWFLESND